MSIATKPIEQITAEDVAAMTASNPEPLRLAVLEAWSPAEAAAAIASLANTSGGLLVVRGAPTDEGDLLSAADSLGAGGRRLVQARVLDAGGQGVGLLAVAESASPPVLVEASGAIYRRTEQGLSQVKTRAQLDQLVTKDLLARKRAETNIEGMVGRVAFGHFNYMTVAVVAAARIITGEPYRWAAEHQAGFVDTALGFARRWGFTAANVEVSPGEVEISLPGDITGFVRIARNGCIAVGERQHRPSQEAYLPAAELSQRLAEMAEVATLPFVNAHAGLVLGSLFLEGVRDLRLPADSGATVPVTKDLVSAFLPERYLEAPEDREAFRRDLQDAAGKVFGADLVRGAAEPYGGPLKATGPQPKNWHGLTKRTERRLAGLRGHGSGR